MSRRVIPAGLPAVALIALTIVLVSSGGGGREPSAIEGQLFQGDEGITRSVAEIRADQRQLDGSPEIQRERTRELAAGETSSVGEHAAEASASIVEKPEPPGEGRMPPKEPATSSRALQRTGSAAIGPKQAVDPSTNFLAAQSGESGFIPPDSMGAVGPSQVVVFVNGVFKVFDKQGNQNLKVLDSAFWAPVSNGSEPTDPGVEYDRLAQRWIVSGINTEDSNNRIMLAVSDGPTITSTSDFTYFFFNEAAPPPAASPRFADYPQLGVDENAVYIGVNEFGAPPATGFVNTTLYVIRKSSILGDGPIVATAFRNLISSGQGPASPQPATDMVPGVDAGYVVGPDANTFSRLDVRKISDPGGTPTISANITVTIPATFAPTPFAVPAQGTTGGLDALDDRFFEAMIGRDPNGGLSLWTAHNLRMNSSGASSAAGDRAGARWYQLGNLGGTPSLIQSGNVFDPAASNPRQFWIPSVAMNGQGHASINMSAAGTTHQAGVAATGRLFGDPLGQTDAFQIAQNGGGTYNLGTGIPRRWGDYSQTVIDPSDNMTFWTFQEYANANNSWALRAIKLLAPPPATPSTPTPDTIPLGQCSVGVDVEGNSTGGSGFFDPGPDPGGPGYPSHISASATGGVEVNDVTYVDPTHVRLDLDTRSAGSGPVDVTITNPDGQSVTASDFVTVDTAGTDPTVPCLNGTTPHSPNNDNNPKIFGSADAGSTVTLYTTSDCTGTPVGSGSASDFATPGIAVSPVADNSSTTYYATATGASNGVSQCSSTLNTAAASETYVEDSIPPVPSIDSGPSGLTNDRTPTFTFAATDASEPVSFECSIDTGTASYGPCSGPGNAHTPSALSDGSYTFHLRATDAAGNRAETQRTFQVDGTPPSVSIDGGPTGATSDRTPTFAFSGSDTHGPVSFQCSFDTGSANFGGCSGPGNTDTPASPLADGSYVFRVRGSDAAANSSVATRPFSVLTPGAPPETTITKGPKKTRKTRPKFKFTSNDPSASFQCRIDKGQFAGCSSPFRTPTLRPGKHKLQVRSSSAAGTDATPAVRKFRILPPS